VCRQNIEISKNVTCKGRTLYRLIRNHLKMFSLEIKIMGVTKYVTDQQDIEISKNCTV